MGNTIFITKVKTSTDMDIVTTIIIQLYQLFGIAQVKHHQLIKVSSVTNDKDCYSKNPL